MAKLQSDNLILEIIFKPFEYEWINYDIKFYWKDDIIINDTILKRDGEFWNKRSYGTFMANDYERDHLIDTIKRVLDTNIADYWEPLEPDAKIAIYPDLFFPFLKNHWILEEKEAKPKKRNNYKNAEDLFTVIIFIDTYNFKDCSAYSGEGISLQMIVTRRDLEKFVADMEKEYDKLEKEYDKLQITRGDELKKHN